MVAVDGWPSMRACCSPALRRSSRRSRTVHRPALRPRYRSFFLCSLASSVRSGAGSNSVPPRAARLTGDGNPRIVVPRDQQPLVDHPTCNGRFAACSRAWPSAWPSPSGPLGWQRLRVQGWVLKILSAERLERIFGCPCGWRGRPGQCAAFRPRRCDSSLATGRLARGRTAGPRLQARHRELRRVTAYGRYRGSRTRQLGAP